LEKARNFCESSVEDLILPTRDHPCESGQNFKKLKRSKFRRVEADLKKRTQKKLKMHFRI